MSSLVYADHFTTGNYYCETGEKKWFKDSTNGNEYYMKLFFCRSTSVTDNYYKFISYNFYLNSEQSSLQDSKDISFPLSSNDGFSFDTIQSMSMNKCELMKNSPCFEFIIKFERNDRSFLYRTLRICHNNGKISITDNDSRWDANSSNTNSVGTPLSDAVYDTSN